MFWYCAAQPVRHEKDGRRTGSDIVVPDWGAVMGVRSILFLCQV